MAEFEKVVAQGDEKVGLFQTDEDKARAAHSGATVTAVRKTRDEAADNYVPGEEKVGRPQMTPGDIRKDKETGLWCQGFTLRFPHPLPGEVVGDYVVWVSEEHFRPNLKKAGLAQERWPPHHHIKAHADLHGFEVVFMTEATDRIPVIMKGTC